MSDTPETDAFFFRTDIVWDEEVEFARKLERKRDSLQDQRDFAMSEIERLRKERDEAREAFATATDQCVVAQAKLREGLAQ